MKIILLYGPPSSGKGTHIRLLSEYTGYPILEPAVLFRMISTKKDSESQAIATKINNGYPITSKDYKALVGKRITELLEMNQSFIMDKPGGSLLNEAKWFLDLVKKYNPEIYLFELHISLRESLRRIASRYFVPSSNASYITYKESLEHCLDGEIPVRRVDDTDTSKARRRYRLLYATKRKNILKLFREHKTKVTEIDATANILTVQEMLRKITA